MRAIVPDALIAEAREGRLAALDALLGLIQPMVFNLAVRMLGNRDDALDATQDILLKVTTHLATFRGEAAFTTWVFQIARNHLLTARTRTREHPESSLEILDQKLEAGLAYGVSFIPTPEDAAEARDIAIRCTQGMLMCLDRQQRLTVLLDVVFGLTSDDAALVLEITPAAYRKRLSRARADLQAFAERRCGLVSDAASCRCARQIPATRAFPSPAPLVFTAHDRQAAEAEFVALQGLRDAAALFRAHPAYRAPETLVAAIRTVLTRTGHFERSDSPSLTGQGA